MHPENEPPQTAVEYAAWWTREYLAARRRKRIRRIVGNVLTFALTFAALTALWLVVNLIER